MEKHKNVYLLPCFDILVTVLGEKMYLFSVLVIYIYNTPSFQGCCVAAKANNIDNLNDKSLTLVSEFGTYVFKWFKTCSTSHTKLYVGVEGSKFEISFMWVVTNGCFPVAIGSPLLWCA